MTTSRLPEITLTCGDGHRFTTRAAGGGSVRCKTCKRSTHVPVDRPRNAKEAAAYHAATVDDHQDQEPEPGNELAGRWNAESAWPGKLTFVPGRDQDECPECAGPLCWEPRRTLTYCTECKQIYVPTVITEHYARQASQSTEVAVRQRADPAAEKAARARLRGQIIKAERWATRWVETIGEPDSYDRAEWQESAEEFAAAMRGWIPEIRSAETEAELAEVEQAIMAELINSQPGKDLQTAYNQSLERAEREEQRQQYAKDLAERQAQLEAAAERDRREEARRERQEAAERSRVADQRKAVTSGTSTRPTIDPTIAQIAVDIKAWQDRRAKDIEEKGACQFKHWTGQVPAERLFGVPARNLRGVDTGSPAPDTPQYRACEKHYDAAVQRLSREGHKDVVYWDLPIVQQAEQPVWGDYGF